MPAVKGIITNNSRFLRIRTEGGNVILHDKIPNLAIGDPVWVFVAEGGKIIKIECCDKHDIPDNIHKKQEEEEQQPSCNEVDSFLDKTLNIGGTNEHS